MVAQYLILTNIMIQNHKLSQMRFSNIMIQNHKLSQMSFSSMTYELAHKLHTLVTSQSAHPTGQSGEQK